jgi:hypothetical protein
MFFFVSYLSFAVDLFSLNECECELCSFEKKTAKLLFVQLDNMPLQQYNFIPTNAPNDHVQISMPIIIFPQNAT